MYTDNTNNTIEGELLTLNIIVPRKVFKKFLLFCFSIFLKKIILIFLENLYFKLNIIFYLGFQKIKLFNNVKVCFNIFLKNKHNPIKFIMN